MRYLSLGGLCWICVYLVFVFVFSLFSRLFTWNLLHGIDKISETHRHSRFMKNDSEHPTSYKTDKPINNNQDVFDQPRPQSNTQIQSRRSQDNVLDDENDRNTNLPQLEPNKNKNMTPDEKNDAKTANKDKDKCRRCRSCCESVRYSCTKYHIWKFFFLIDLDGV